MTEPSIYLPLEKRMRLAGCWPSKHEASRDWGLERDPDFNGGWCWKTNLGVWMGCGSSEAINVLSRGLEDWLLSRGAFIRQHKGQFKLTGMLDGEIYEALSIHEVLVMAGVDHLPKEDGHG